MEVHVKTYNLNLTNKQKQMHTYDFITMRTIRISFIETYVGSSRLSIKNKQIQIS